MEDNTTNFVQVEGHLDPSVKTNMTTSEDNTVSMKPKVEAKTGQKPEKKLNKTEQRLKRLFEIVESQDKNIQYLAQYIDSLERQLGADKARETACILEILNTVYKDCKTIKEADLTPETAKDYVTFGGPYLKKLSTKETVKLIPLEDGWKLVSVVPDNKEDPKEYTGVFEFKGIAPKPDYPTTFTVVSDKPYSFIAKLREYLLSIKGEIVMSNESINTK